MYALLGSLVESIVGWVARGMLLFGFYFAGKKSARSEIIADESTVKDKQLEIAARPTLSRDELLAKLRNNLH